MPNTALAPPRCDGVVVASKGEWRVGLLILLATDLGARQVVRHCAGARELHQESRRRATWQAECRVLRCGATVCREARQRVRSLLVPGNFRRPLVARIPDIRVVDSTVRQCVVLSVEKEAAPSRLQLASFSVVVEFDLLEHRPSFAWSLMLQMHRSRLGRYVILSPTLHPESTPTTEMQRFFDCLLGGVAPGTEELSLALVEQRTLAFANRPIVCSGAYSRGAYATGMCAWEATSNEQPALQDASCGVDGPLLLSETRKYGVSLVASRAWWSSCTLAFELQRALHTSGVQLILRESASWHLILDSLSCVLLLGAHELIRSYKHTEGVLHSLAHQCFRYCWLLVDVCDNGRATLERSAREALSMLEQSVASRGLRLLVRLHSSTTHASQLVFQAIEGAAQVASEIWPVRGSDHLGERECEEEPELNSWLFA